MKKITLYTAADKRPDFIPLQYQSLKRFLKDEYEFVVLNNALDSKKRQAEISRICSELGIRCVKVTKDKKFNIIGEQKVFTWLGSYRNANVGTAYPIKWAWNMMIEENSHNLFAIIDSDMFLCRDISFIEEIGDNDSAIIIQYRGPQERRSKMNVSYIWNALCVFDASKIPDLKAMRWDCGTVNGHRVDVGGYIHHWFQNHKMNYRHMSEYAVHKYHGMQDGSYYLEGTLNGNYHFSFEYNDKTRVTKNFKSYERNWAESDLVLPHLRQGFENVLTAKMINYFERYIKNKQTYPDPAFIGFIEFEDQQKKNKPFIIHSKAGSGYMRFGEQYGKMKLQFIEKILEL